MKTENIIAAGFALLVITHGIQAYITFKLYNRLNTPIIQYEKTQNPNISIFSSPKIRIKDNFSIDRSLDPYEEMQRMQTEMKQMISESFFRFHMRNPIINLTRSPDVDLQDKLDRYVVTANVPGGDESTMNIRLKDKRKLDISIKTEKDQDESNHEKSEYQYRERFVGEFHRILTLPGPGDPSKLKTDYRNGVITITIPKNRLITGVMQLLN